MLAVAQVALLQCSYGKWSFQLGIAVANIRQVLYNTIWPTDIWDSDPIHPKKCNYDKLADGVREVEKGCGKGKRKRTADDTGWGADWSSSASSSSRLGDAVTAGPSHCSSRPSTREREWTAPTVEATVVAAVWPARPTAGPQGAAPGSAEEAAVPHVAGRVGRGELIPQCIRSSNVKSNIIR